MKEKINHTVMITTAAAKIDAVVINLRDKKKLFISPFSQLALEPHAMLHAGTHQHQAYGRSPHTALAPIPEVPEC